MDPHWSSFRDDLRPAVQSGERLRDDPLHGVALAYWSALLTQARACKEPAHLPRARNLRNSLRATNLGLRLFGASTREAGTALMFETERRLRKRNYRAPERAGFLKKRYENRT